MTSSDSSPERSRSADSKVWNILFLVIVAGSCLTLFFRPLTPEPWQWADDALYYKNAIAISDFLRHPSLQWLGSFNSLVLAKPPLFPLFVAFAYKIGLPLRLAEWFLFLPLPFLLRLALRPIDLSPRLTLCLGGFWFLSIPAIGIETRLLRSVLYGALLLYALIFFSGYAIRQFRQRSNAAIWIGFSAFSGGLASVTREEGLWIFLPITCGIVAITVARRLKLLAVVSSAMLAIVAYLIPYEAVSLLNWRSYGVFSPSLRQNSAFRDLVNLLSSLEPDFRLKYVPIITDTRVRVYDVSPAFRELRPYLEGPALDHIATSEPHHRLNSYLGKREFFVSNFDLALAHAIFLAGNSTGAEFIDFCSKAANEIRNAVREGKIKAGPKGFGFLPPLTMEKLPLIASAALRSGVLLFRVSALKIQQASVPPMQPEVISWFAVTRTWPSTGTRHHVSKFFFSAMVIILQLFYSIGICFFLITVFVAVKRKLIVRDEDLLIVCR